VLSGLERAAFAATRTLAIAGLLLLLAFAAATLSDGVMRWLFNRPIDAVRDLGNLVVAIVISCCFPLAFLERSNISIRLVGSMSPMAGRVLDAAAAVVVGLILILIATQFFKHAGQFAHAGDKTWMFDIPVAPFWYAVTAVLWFAVAIQMLVVVLETLRCFGREWSGSVSRDAQ